MLHHVAEFIVIPPVDSPVHALEGDEVSGGDWVAELAVVNDGGGCWIEFHVLCPDFYDLGQVGFCFVPAFAVSHVLCDV